jgi:hypothetical protein
MTDGDLREFEAVIHPKAVNREAAREPMASRGMGPAAWYATGAESGKCVTMELCRIN